MGLRHNILQDPVSELEWREALTLDARHTVRDAIQLMKARRIGCVVVLDEAGRVAGEFTERHVGELLLTDPAQLDQPLSKHLSEAWGRIRPTDTVADLIHLMERRRLRFVIVVDEQGRPLGLTGQRGLVEYVVDWFPRAVRDQPMEAKLAMDQREGG